MRRARFNSGQRYTAPGQGFQQTHQSARLVRRRQHQRRLVLTTAFRRTASDDEKTCRVVRCILYILGQNRQVIDPRRILAGDGRRVQGIVPRHL